MREGFCFNKLFFDFPRKKEVKCSKYNPPNYNYIVETSPYRHYQDKDKSSFLKNETSCQYPYINEVTLNNINLNTLNNDKKENKFKSYVVLSKNKKKLSKSVSINKTPYCYDSELPMIKVKDLDSNKILDENSQDRENKVLKRINIIDVIYFDKKFIKKPFKF
jgi:hypothetical protein